MLTNDLIGHGKAEAVPSHVAAEAAATGWLTRLRSPAVGDPEYPALLRTARAEAGVAMLGLVGIPAAIVSGEGRIRAANDRFAKRLGERALELPSGLRFANRLLQSRFAAGLATLRADGGPRSVAVAGSCDAPACAIHMIPLHGGVSHVLGCDGVLLLLAEAGGASVPDTGLLRLLFDLTPTEARLTRHMAEGRSLAETAPLLGITQGTARTHLRSVFAKTGVRRQAELVRLLLGLGEPA